VSRSLPALNENEALDLVHTATALAGMLYPAATPPPVLTELYAQEPELAAASPPLPATLSRALAALAAGLPTLR
jgi:glutamine synthetase